MSRDKSVRRSAQDDDFCGYRCGFISPSREELGVGPQGSGGIDGGGSPRWNQAREGGREDDDCYGGGVDGRVYRRHIEELAAQCSRGEDGDRDRNRDSNARQDQNFSQDEANYFPLLRSQSHAYPNLAGALGGRVGQDSVKSNAREEGG